MLIKIPFNYRGERTQGECVFRAMRTVVSVSWHNTNPTKRVGLLQTADLIISHWKLTCFFFLWNTIFFTINCYRLLFFYCGHSIKKSQSCYNVEIWCYRIKTHCRQYLLNTLNTNQIPLWKSDWWSISDICISFMKEWLMINIRYLYFF
jgi:hypothetical protein